MVKTSYLRYAIALNHRLKVWNIWRRASNKVTSFTNTAASGISSLKNSINQLLIGTGTGEMRIIPIHSAGQNNSLGISGLIAWMLYRWLFTPLCFLTPSRKLWSRMPTWEEIVTQLDRLLVKLLVLCTEWIIKCWNYTPRCKTLHRLGTMYF